MPQAELFENEEIKQIENFPNYYITSFGRVWSEHSHKFLKPTINKKLFLIPIKENTLILEGITVFIFIN